MDSSRWESNPSLWFDGWASVSGRALYGECARALLDSGEVHGGQALVLLPLWDFVVPGINMGRKGRNISKFPVRRAWSAPMLLVDENARWSGEWLIDDMGVKESGSVSVVASGSGCSRTEVGTGETEVVAPVMPKRALVAELSSLAEDGELAWWELLMGFEGLVRSRVEQAHVALSIEVAGDSERSTPLLDSRMLDSVVDRILFGSDNRHPFKSLLARAMGDPSGRRADTLKYVSDSVRSMAWREIRRVSGDPNVGSKIRAVAREIGSSDVHEVLDAYNEREKSHVSAVTVVRALTVVPTGVMRSLRD